MNLKKKENKFLIFCHRFRSINFSSIIVSYFAYRHKTYKTPYGVGFHRHHISCIRKPLAVPGVQKSFSDEYKNKTPFDIMKMRLPTA